MKCLVTGCAGFIGSHLAEKLLAEGYQVVGLDCFTDFYPRWIKQKNLSSLLHHCHFQFIEDDLNQVNLKKILEDIDFIFHLAAQAGVRTSWGKNFKDYLRNNIQATQRLLEAVKNKKIEKLIFASSSSVYGLSPFFPMRETGPVQPISPYGVTKLAAEQLCFLYFKNYGLPTISLRFFTVYGPRQRPDMAFHKFLLALLKDEPITLYGDGHQTRDFTFIDDIIEASLLAMKRGKPGEVYNIGGGHQKELAEVIEIMERITNRKARITWVETQKGDVLHTLASIEKAQHELGYQPKTNLENGLRQQWVWLKELYGQN
ncbi:MAG: GDP-mannose 4,6-dehydratase [Candidatus Aminicenantes bacterium]|nr:GDP-mannose 4,6-dehydratase [Candidatus Aminicenantes bacterium]